MSIYPLPMRFPVPLDGTSGRRAREEGRDLRIGEYLDVSISPNGWQYMRDSDRTTFASLPVADRLEYRRAFAVQVELAKNTSGCS
jgi:hypothetical protein